MTTADHVRREMNRCGAGRRPFLFGFDFECRRGFFIEDPLHDTRLLFSVRGTTNAPAGKTLPHAATPAAPRLDILRPAPDAYARKFATVRNGLLRGDTFLLNLTERTPVRCNLSLPDIFHRSRAPYRLLMPGRFVCFSPEPFIRISSGGTLSTFPMKGTIDATLPGAERLLLENYKETCEHYTIVDLLRNDLNRVARGVRVTRFRYVDRIATLRGEILQTSSEITGTLPAGWHATLGDLLATLLPAGSVSGAPKPSTLRIIRAAEGIPRGYYTGVFGYYDGSTLDSAVLIRYIEQEGDSLYFRSGGGITVHSRPEDEYREILEKIYLPIPGNDTGKAGQPKA